MNQYQVWKALKQNNNEKQQFKRKIKLNTDKQYPVTKNVLTEQQKEQIVQQFLDNISNQDQINNFVKTLPKNINIEQSYQNMVQRNQMVQLKKELLKLQYDQINDCSFQPQINDNSKKLLLQREYSQDRLQNGNKYHYSNSQSRTKSSKISKKVYSKKNEEKFRSRYDKLTEWDKRRNDKKFGKFVQQQTELRKLIKGQQEKSKTPKKKYVPSKIQIKNEILYIKFFTVQSEK